MVRFEPDRFVIEVVTHTNPIDGWLELQEQLLRLVSSQDKDQPFNPYLVLDLLRDMLPTEELAKRMTS